MFCKECNKEMRIDDTDKNFPGNENIYYVCDNCETSCIEQIRFNQSFKEIWHSENNGKIKDWEIKHKIQTKKGGR